MKRVNTFLAAIVFAVTLWAQGVDKIGYQTVVRSNSNGIVANSNVGIKISILQGSVSGTAVYVETQTSVTNANGLLTIEIGGGAVVSGSFAGINWASGSSFIKTEIDTEGGTNYAISSTSQLLSIPYALYSKTAGGVSYTGIDSKPVNIDDDKTDDMLKSGDQTIAGNKTFTGTTTVIAPVNVSDITNKAYVDTLIARIIELEHTDALTHGFTDPRDGNFYKSVKIGKQVWMIENLRYLPSVSKLASSSATEPHYYVYGYDGTDVTAAKASVNYKDYGVLYNWPAVMAGAVSSGANPSGVQGICPPGWHLPSDAEWEQLISYLGNANVVGEKLKETGTAHWASPNAATNTSNFSAYGGGFYYAANFRFIRNVTSFWSTTEDGSKYAWTRGLSYSSTTVYRESNRKEYGASVRCVKD